MNMTLFQDFGCTWDVGFLWRSTSCAIWKPNENSCFSTFHAQSYLYVSSMRMITVQRMLKEKLGKGTRKWHFPVSRPPEINILWSLATTDESPHSLFRVSDISLEDFIRISRRQSTDVERLGVSRNTQPEVYDERRRIDTCAEFWNNFIVPWWLKSPCVSFIGVTDDRNVAFWPDWGLLSSINEGVF